jgi:hypothetical protein
VKKQIQLASGKMLHVPVERDVALQSICVKTGESEIFRGNVQLSQNRIDAWMCIYLPETQEALVLEAAGDFVEACFTNNTFIEDGYEEKLRPHIHYTTYRGDIIGTPAVTYQDGLWYMQYMVDGLAGDNKGQAVYAVSTDLLHWNVWQTPALVTKTPTLEAVETKAAWLGDVEESFAAKREDITYLFAKSKKRNFADLPIGQFIGLPAVVEKDKLVPAPMLENLRVWTRKFDGIAIDGDFYFDMRFRIAPGPWPDITILPKDNTVDDIKAQAAEIDLELFVGQDHHIDFDISGVAWRWEALTQTLHCKEHVIPLKQEQGRIKLKFYCDRIGQTLFTEDGRAVLIIAENGAGFHRHKIQHAVENVNNESFAYGDYKDPYIRITPSGKATILLRMDVYGLRPARYSRKTQAVLDTMTPGERLYQGENYTVYENCVQDDVYGPPAAWATPKGVKIVSPVRTIEEFEWRATPWGDMTRVIDRGEIWKKPEGMEHYPALESGTPTLDATFNLATGILHLNSDPTYNLPGQQGLINAALFQGKGEGFGIWVRDTSHNAFRIMNFIAPQEIKKSLKHIMHSGFNNGVDSNAMPAIGVWDHYVTTGDKPFLYETLPGILAFAKKADAQFDEEKGLMHAAMSPAQDAFEEPENAGYCIGTEIYYANMYLAVSNILDTLELEAELSRKYQTRGREMLNTIKALYWNEEKGLFSSGPKGSPAYEKGEWEATGAELCVWPKFEMATPAQRSRFLDEIETRMSDFGLNWYPFQPEKNHFWGSCWVSWTLGIAAAAGRESRLDLLEKLIFQQVRNGMLNKTFHEVIDNDTGRAWRWPGLPWHSAGFVGFILYGVFGISYDLDGLQFFPAVPKAFADSKLRNLHYKNAVLDFEIQGWGTAFDVYLDGEHLEKPVLPTDLKDHHTVRFVAKQ